MNEKGIFIQSYAYHYYFLVYFTVFCIHFVKEKQVLCGKRGNLNQDYLNEVNIHFYPHPSRKRDDIYKIHFTAVPILQRH